MCKSDNQILHLFDDGYSALFEAYFSGWIVSVIGRLPILLKSVLPEYISIEKPVYGTVKKSILCNA